MMTPIEKIDTMTIGYIPQPPSLKCFHRPAMRVLLLRAEARDLARDVVRFRVAASRAPARVKPNDARIETRKIAARDAIRTIAISKAPMYPRESARRTRGGAVRGGL